MFIGVAHILECKPRQRECEYKTCLFVLCDIRLLNLFICSYCIVTPGEGLYQSFLKTFEICNFEFLAFFVLFFFFGRGC